MIRFATRHKNKKRCHLRFLQLDATTVPPCYKRSPQHCVNTSTTSVKCLTAPTSLLYKDSRTCRNSRKRVQCDILSPIDIRFFRKDVQITHKTHKNTKTKLALSRNAFNQHQHIYKKNKCQTLSSV